MLLALSYICLKLKINQQKFMPKTQKQNFFNCKNIDGMINPGFEQNNKNKNKTFISELHFPLFYLT